MTRWPFVALALAASSAAARDYDWCSTIVVRPDQNWRDAATCTPRFTVSEISRGAESVWMGGASDVSHPVIEAPGDACSKNPSHATMAPYIASLKAARAAAGGPPLWIVNLHRFDLVAATFMALPGFRASFLLRTTRPWADVLGFFSGSTSPVCLPAGCRWTDSYGSWEGYDTGKRMRDYIDASGGPGSYQSAVYYLARMAPGETVGWATTVMADLRDPAYRAWRVAEAKEALRVGGYNLVDLNQKLPHYLFGPHWLGTGTNSTVASIQASGENGWSAQPTGYTYPEYVQGLVALAADLRAAGVPYSFSIALRSWGSDSFDWAATPAVNEAEMLREIMRGAAVVFFDQPMDLRPPGMVEQATLGLPGVQVLMYDQGCGLSTNPLGAPKSPALLN